MDLSGFYNQFREETADNIRVLNDGLLALEQIPDASATDAQEQINTVFRAMHTIKGSARLLGFETIARVAHVMEDVLGAARAGTQSIDQTLANDLLRGGDAIMELTAEAIDNQPTSIDVESLIAKLQRSQNDPDGLTKKDTESSQQPTPAVQSAASSEATPDTGAPRRPAADARRHARHQQTIRVRVDRLDRLINLTGELVVEQQVLTSHTQALQTLTKLVQQQAHALLQLEQHLERLRFSDGQRQTLNEQIVALWSAGNQVQQVLHTQSEYVDQHMSHQRLLIGDLEDEVMTLRLLPIATLFTKLPRAVRELAQATSKEVALTLHGEATELDRKLLDALHDPLLHLIRNAVDHGIEPPDERVAQGKPAQGQITICAEASSGEVQISIRDDGRGMQPDTLRATAVHKGLITTERAELLSQQEALELIFLPGFSTNAMITDISGRGVGMDVVQANIREIGGQVMLASTPEQGTTVRLHLPLTLVTTRILLVNVGSHTLAFPVSGCRGIMWVDRSDMQTIEGRATIGYKGQTLPLLSLAEILAIQAAPPFQHHERMPVLLLSNPQQLVGVFVDQLLDEREAVVKSLGPLFEHRRRYNGAVQLGDGQLVLLLNPSSLLQDIQDLVIAKPLDPSHSNQRSAQLLIVDDSFTTREMIRSIMQSAGYTVTTAVDGLDALDKLRRHTYDLVISDIEMPRINGFQLTSRIRQESGLSDLPVIIITSLASDEHRRQGLEVGAQAYIVKSQFDQGNLLDVVQQLLGKAA